MSTEVFEPMEIAELAAHLERLPDRRTWTRRRGSRGEDVIEIEIAGAAPRMMRLRKMDGAYAVTGFGGWALAIFEDLTGMMNALAERTFRTSSRTSSLPISQNG